MSLHAFDNSLKWRQETSMKEMLKMLNRPNTVMEAEVWLFTALKETLSFWWSFANMERKRERPFSERTGGSSATGKAWVVPMHSQHRSCNYMELWFEEVGTSWQHLPLKLDLCRKWDQQFQLTCIYLKPKSFLPALVKELNSGKRDWYRKEINKIYEVTPPAGRCSWLRAVWNMLFFGFSISKTILPIWSHLPHNVDCRLSLWESRIRLLTFS